MENNLRQLQLTQLEILKVIDGVCKKHDIAYSLYAGTLLGAVRHQGFIPWDDDLDVCMSRENYNRFQAAWKAESPAGYLLQNKETEPDFSQTFTKIRKEHTTFWQENEPGGEYHLGIFVDVFPIDRMPSGTFKRWRFRWDCLRFLLYTREQPPIYGTFFEAGLVKLLLALKPREKRQAARRALLQKITSLQDPGCNTVGIETVKSARKPLPPDLMDDYVFLPFEDGVFPCFAKWQEYLTVKFGNYRQLPPEGERVWKHRPLLLDFTRDYEEIRFG